MEAITEFVANADDAKMEWITSIVDKYNKDRKIQAKKRRHEESLQQDLHSQVVALIDETEDSRLAKDLSDSILVRSLSLLSFTRLAETARRTEKLDRRRAQGGDQAVSGCAFCPSVSAVSLVCALSNTRSSRRHTHIHDLLEYYHMDKVSFNQEPTTVFSFLKNLKMFDGANVESLTMIMDAHKQPGKFETRICLPILHKDEHKKLLDLHHRKVILRKDSKEQTQDAVRRLFEGTQGCLGEFTKNVCEELDKHFA